MQAEDNLETARRTARKLPSCLSGDRKGVRKQSWSMLPCRPLDVAINALGNRDAFRKGLPPAS